SQFSLFNSGIVAESRAIHALLQQIDVAARCDFTILVSGESGTGKELVARAIDKRYLRRRRRCIP
ncbi:MAG TPA: sigma 54-interacting transcriptional regulator, partial [Pyrinomonadaceae bacterium]|nr:sigma 54-interacting transcriptional regulator [Pyrinomonadaceae bacterium]